MAIRKLENWLDSYMEYTEGMEPARTFQMWVGISAIASALRKKVYLSLGRIKVYANMYIILVAEPGIARKSQAISTGVELMSGVPDIVMSADAMTKEALLVDMQECVAQEIYLDGTVLDHCSLNIISREFESFLGQKKENTKMLVLLTDLFDCQELPWKYRTKHSGNSTIQSLYLNMLAATTPESLASCLPSTAIGGGLTSRMIFVWGERKSKKVAIPLLTDKIKILKDALIQDLYLISRIVGTYEFSEDARTKWIEWYNKYEELDTKRICKDPTFNGWYSRKPTYILKIALVMAAAESGDLIVEWRHVQRSLDMIELAEHDMSGVFRAVGKSFVSTEVDTIMQLVKIHGWITEKSLLSKVWKDMDSIKFDNVIKTAMRTGKVDRTFKGPDGTTDVWYYWVQGRT
jgi:hypothetical protein